MFKPIRDCLGAIPLPASRPPGEGSASNQAGPFSFQVVAGPEVQGELFDDCEQLCMFFKRHAE